MTQDCPGRLGQVDQAAVSGSLRRIEKPTVRVLGVQREIVLTPEAAEALIIDGAEQPVQGPHHHRRRWYSGTKKRHTIKTEIIVTKKALRQPIKTRA